MISVTATHVEALTICSSYELESKLLKGDYMRDYHRGCQEETRGLDYGSWCILIWTTQA